VANVADGSHLRSILAVIEVPAERFEELVGTALDGIPDELAELIDNVVVLVEDGMPGGGLLGRYQGVPLTERGAWYGAGGLTMPDRITIFRLPICGLCSTEDEVVEQVKITVVHEVAHHFGISDRRLTQLGWG
jgi:predicted Zn-dependent protease with MMP-like domain